MKKEAPLPCGLVDVRSYIPGVGFYACHLPQGHDGACALNPAEAYFASVDADKAIKAAETLFRMAAAPPEAE
jgi:hypothetical protein